MLDVKKLNDSDLIHYLLTTDFKNETLSSSEYKYLLDRFQTFYKTKLLLNNSLIEMNKKLKKEIDAYKKEPIKVVYDNRDEVEELRLKVHELSNRKLTFKERLLGKIYIKK